MYIRRISLNRARQVIYASAWLLGAATIALQSLSCSREAVISSKPPRSAAVIPATPPVIDVREVDGALTTEEAAAYAGNAACRSCHTALCDQQNASRNARTLRPVTVAEHGAQFSHNPAVTDPLLGVEYATTVQNEKCLLRGIIAGYNRGEKPSLTQQMKGADA